MMSLVRMKFPGEVLVEYDPQADAAYVRLRDGRVARTRQETPSVLLDLDSKGRLLGVEFLHPRTIRVGVTCHLAERYRVPKLGRINLRAIPQVYAAA